MTITKVLFKIAILSYKLCIPILLTINVNANNEFHIDCDFSIRNLSEIESISMISSQYDIQEPITNCHFYVTSEEKVTCGNCYTSETLYDYIVQNNICSPWSNYFSMIKRSIRKRFSIVNLKSTFSNVIEFSKSESIVSVKDKTELDYSVINMQSENLIKIKYKWKPRRNILRRMLSTALHPKSSMNADSAPLLNNTKQIPIQKIIYSMKNYYNLEIDTGLPDYKSLQLYLNSLAAIYAGLGLTGLASFPYGLHMGMPYLGLFAPLGIFFIFEAYTKSKLKPNFKLINVAIPLISRMDLIKSVGLDPRTKENVDDIRKNLTIEFQKKINSLFSYTWISTLQKKQKVIFIEDNNTSTLCNSKDVL